MGAFFKFFIDRFNKTPLYLFFALILAFAFFTPSSALAANGQVYPKEINGLPVVFVHTSANTVGLVGDQAILVLCDSAPGSFQDAEKRWDFADYWATHSLPKNWTITIFGGPNTSVESYISKFKANNVSLPQTGIKSVLPSSIKPQTATYHASYAAVQDTDSSISGLRAYWYSPTPGPYQNNYSGLMINGVTNYATPYFWLQCGQWFDSTGTGHNFWSTYYYGGQPQSFNGVPYGNGDWCQFSLYYVGTGYWQMSAYDISTGQYQSVQQIISGTTLATNVDTSVWFENVNTNAAWYSSFTNPCSVTYAEEYTGSYWQAWSNQLIKILDAYGQPQSNNGKITGSLTSHSTANWYLDKLLLGAYY